MKADEIWVGVALANESGLSCILIFCCKLSCSWIISASWCHSQFDHFIM